MTDAIDTFLTLDPLIVTRLKTRLPDVQVLDAADLDDVTEDSQPAPAIHVIYNGFSVMQTQAHGKAAIFRMSWLVVACVKHAGSGTKAAREAKARAATIVAQANDALMGFRPDTRPGTPGLVPATPPRPMRRGVFYYFPLLFTADVPVATRSQ